MIFRKKVSPSFIYALWLLVAVRLLLPFSFGNSDISVMNILPQVGVGVWVEGLYASEQSNDTSNSNNTAQSSDMAQTNNIAQSNDTSQSNNTAQFHDTVNSSSTPDIAGDTPSTTVITPDASDSQNLTNAKSSVENSLRTEAVLKYVYLAGALLSVIIFAAGNIGFYRKLRRSRKLSGLHSPLKVYVTQAIPGPCLFGLISPAVYLTPRALESETKARHILAHELTHFRHFDHIWGFVRMLAVTLHWYNPLVWLAALLSKQDGELCCDAGTVKVLGEKSRLSYARTLIETAADGRRVDILCAASTLSVGKHGMKGRISMLSKKRKTATVLLCAALLLTAVAVGCTFTSAEGKEPKNDTVQGEKDATGINPSDHEKDSEALPGTKPDALSGTQTGTQTDAHLDATTDTKPGTQPEDMPTAPVIELTEAEKNAKPFMPDQMQEITSAKLQMSFGTYTLEDEVKIDRLERTLADATVLDLGAGCPFSSILYLTRADGEAFYVRHAEDSCQTLEVNGVYYEYDVDAKSSFDFFSLFGVQQDHTEYEYDSAGRVTKETDYYWQTPGDMKEYVYDARGNLTKETYTSGDKSIVREKTSEYDAKNRLIRRSTKSGDDFSHEELYTYDSNGNLISMISYNADGSLRSKELYSYDIAGRLLEIEFNPDDIEDRYRHVYEYKSDREYSMSIYNESEQLSYVYKYTNDHAGNMLKSTHILQDGVVEMICDYDYGERDGVITMTRTMYPGKDDRQEVVDIPYELFEFTKLSVIPEDYGISTQDILSISASDFSQYSIVKLCVYYLNLEGAIAQDAAKALYRRFMNNPEDVLLVIALMGNQETRNKVADYTLCEAIAMVDAIWHGGSPKFEDLMGPASVIDPTAINKTYLSLMNNLWQEAKQSE
jgi:beta-lactamase regulating signal transducer with metallopeptidase domain